MFQNGTSSLDAIIAVGYRVNSKKATRFRQWVTKTLMSHNRIMQISGVFKRVGNVEFPKLQNEALDDALESKLLLTISKNPQITQKDIVKEIGTSRATVQRLMKTLTQQGKIERVGGKRFGYWEIHK